jgi:hypothetical protein
VRIASTAPETLPSVAFKTSEGKKVVVIANDTGSTQVFALADHGASATASLKRRCSRNLCLVTFSAPRAATRESPRSD